MTAITHQPLGRKVVTKPFLVLGLFVLIAAYFILRRFLFGMGAVSNMSNGYPIGTWVVLDVVIGTAFGCGAGWIAGAAAATGAGAGAADSGGATKVSVCGGCSV